MKITTTLIALWFFQVMWGWNTEIVFFNSQPACTAALTERVADANTRPVNQRPSFSTRCIRDDK